MIVLYIILGVIALVLISALFVPKDINYEKSISIKSDMKNVWKNVNSHAAMDKWSPWDTKDPNMKKTLTGTDGTIGAKQAWVSKVKGVGEGSQTITKLEEPNLMETRLEFLKPFKSIAEAYVKLSGEDKNTKVTWGFKSKMPYPMNLMKLFMNFEREMDKEFGEGLSKLKAICESETV